MRSGPGTRVDVLTESTLEFGDAETRLIGEDTPEVPPVTARYRILGTLGRGGMGVVSHAYDRLLGHDVALKQILYQTDAGKGRVSRSVSRLAALTREFQTLARLRHPHIISVVDYGLDEHGKPFFTMDLVEGAVSIVQAGRRADERTRLRLMVQLLHALHFLHRRSLIHRDLKPSNVLVADDAVKVLDFGLSAAVEALRGDCTVAGTLHYLAPEVLQGDPPSSLSDLFAVGIIGYHVLTGRRPFEGSGARVRRAIVGEDPDLDDPELDNPLGEWVKAMLAKDPADRPPSAQAVLENLQRHLPDDDRHRRRVEESFIQAAPLVGRDDEVHLLETGLDEAVTGRGGAWLVDGVSGSGKSRLIDELRIHALVRGALVFQGQALDAGGSPYQCWRSIVRALLLHAPLGRGLVPALRPLVDDLEELLERRVPEPPGRVGEDAILSAVLRLLENLQRPALLLIDDAQWAGEESIRLLRQLLPHLPRLRVQIVLTNRSEEAPRLGDQLPGVLPVRLDDLPPPAIAELCRSMLGPGGEDADLVARLQHETEGNAFFLVEAVRELARRAGGLAAVDRAHVPDEILSGGMRAALDRHLDQLAGEDRDALHLAAVYGREIDPEVLAAAGVDDVDAWLLRAAEKVVVEVYDNRWRIAHDKLRNAALARIDGNWLPGYHARLGEGIERHHHRHLDAVAERLVHHWSHAGRSERAAIFAEPACGRALAGGAYREAIRYAELFLAGRDGRGLRTIRRGDLHALAGEAHYRHGNLEPALAHLRRADRLHGLIDLESPPWTGAGVPFFLLRRLFPFLRRGGRRSGRFWRASQGSALKARLAIYRSRNLAIVGHSLHSLDLGGACGRTNVYSLGIAACAAGAAGLERVTERAFRRCLVDAREQGDLAHLVDARVMEGSYRIGQAEWRDAHRALEHARAVAERIGYRVGQAEALAVHSIHRLHRGDLPAMEEELRAGIDLLGEQSRGHRPGLVGGIALAMVYRGESAEAQAEIERCRRDHEITNALSLALLHAAAALACLRDGRTEEATDEALACVRRIGTPASIPPVCDQVFTAPLEVFAANWERAGKGPEARRWRAQFDAVLKKLGGWARCHPLGGSLHAWWTGHRRRLAGDARAAAAHWHRALGAAEDLDAVFFRARIAASLGRHVPGHEKLEAESSRFFARSGAFGER